MEAIRKLIRQQLTEMFEKENSIALGEYTTEQMEEFLSKLIPLIKWSDENYGSGPSIAIPSSWPSSSVSYTEAAIRGNWEESKKRYNEPDTRWYVWTATVGDKLQKPVFISPQRIILNTILKVTSNLPETFRYLSIGVTNSKIRDMERSDI